MSDAFPPPLATVNLHAAGIDVGAEEHWAAVPAGDDPQPVRHCGAHTADFDALADGLGAGDSTPVALEATGVSWLPRCEVLEARGFPVLRVDPGQRPRHGRPQPAVPDGQGLQRLHPSGLRAACCRPEAPVVGLRRSVRQRAARLADAARDIPPLQKALPQMHVQRQHVVSDIPGVPGMATRQAILAGARAPQRLAQ